MAWLDLGKLSPTMLRPFWSEIWWRTWRSVKKGFYRNISINRKATENVCLLLNGLWDQWQRIQKRSRNAVSTLPQSFNGRICLQESQASETRKSEARDLTLGRSRIRVGTLKQARPTQSVRPDGMHHKCGVSWLMSCLSWLQGFWHFNFLIGKPVNSGWDKLAVGCTENWLHPKLKGDVSSSTKCILTVTH